VGQEDGCMDNRIEDTLVLILMLILGVALMLALTLLVVFVLATASDQITGGAGVINAAALLMSAMMISVTVYIVARKR